VKKLIASGKISRNDSVLLCVTGNGLKPLDAVAGHRGQAVRVRGAADAAKKVNE